MTMPNKKGESQDLEKRLKIWRKRHHDGAHCVATLKDVEWLIEMLKQAQAQFPNLSEVSDV
jgi:hypothetical protein